MQVVMAADATPGSNEYATMPPPSPPSVISNHLDVIETSVLIIGGGPHALAVLSALNERSLAFPSFTSDATFSNRVGFGSLEKVGTACVLDPGRAFLEDWRARFSALEITHLRSPAFAHPQAYEPQALVSFAVSQGRIRELIDIPVVTSRLATEGNDAQEPTMYGLPTTALFNDFCASLEAKLPHRWVRGRAAQLFKDRSADKFRVRYTDGDNEGWVVADAVVLATGPAGQRNVPGPFRPLMQHHQAGPAAGSCVMHTEDFLRSGKTVASMVSKLAGCGKTAGGVQLLVIGGGLTAAQAALAAVAAGCKRVVLRSRRPLTTRAYDLSSNWLDQRHATRLRSEFFATPTEERLKMVRSEVHGGSVPEPYMKKLRHVARTSGRLELQV